jgi:hypothetical protein
MKAPGRALHTLENDIGALPKAGYGYDGIGC